MSRWNSSCARAVLGLVVGHGSCARERSPVAPPTRDDTRLRGWDYVMTLDEGLHTARLDICFDGRPPAALIPGAAKHVRWLTAAVRADGQPLPQTDDRVVLDGVPIDGCVALTLDVDAMAPKDGGRSAGRLGDSVMARAAAWLWRPRGKHSGAASSIRFDVPPGVAVSTPWPTVDGSPPGPASTYALDATAYAWMAYVAWGELHTTRTERAGVELQITRLDRPIACDEDGLHRWLGDAAETVALLFGGRFPKPTLQVMLIPLAPRGGTVEFGMAGRGGGPSIFLLLDSGAEAEALPGTWTTIHEMLHHGMPFIREPWMAEGWVTYYTEVLRARQGSQSPAEAWQRMLEGFGRGERGGRNLSLRAVSEQMHETFAYARVYWGGAAIALLTDLAVREDSGGKLSLDDAMVELHRCCGDTGTRQHAGALLAHLDQWYGKPLFTSVAEQYLTDAAFPPVVDALANLGVSLAADGGVELDPAHPAASTRDAIMARSGGTSARAVW